MDSCKYVCKNTLLAPYPHCTLQAWNEPNAALFTAVPHMSVFTETEQTPARPLGVAETQKSNDNGF